MNDTWRTAATVVGLVALMAAAFLLARSWQTGDGDFQRLAPVSDCDLRAGECRQPLGAGMIGLSIEPREIPLMQTLALRVVADGIAADRVTVEIRGLNMEMGLNRTRLESDGTGGWHGETILPICSQRRMEWEAAVQVEGAKRYEVPFPFATTRP